jgi:hypothetical protein
MGWWVSRAGEIYPNPDHYTFVLSHPKLFGMTAREVKGYGLDERQGVLDRAIASGWLRVRGDQRQGITFEVQALDEPTVFAMKTFLSEKAWDPNAKILVEEQISRGRAWYEPAAWVLSDGALAVARNPGKRKQRQRVR